LFSLCEKYQLFFRGNAIMLRAVIEVAYSVRDVFQGLPYALIAMGVFVGGLFLWNILFMILERIALRKERGTAWILEKKATTEGDHIFSKWMKRPSWSWSSLWHFLLQTLFFGGIVMIIWLAGASAGFNPWTTAAASLGMTLAGTYIFATPLSLLGSGYFLIMSNSIAVGQYWEFLGMPGWDGRIHAIYYMEVEMERYDEEKGRGELMSIPISQFLSTPRKRIWEKEKNALITIVPDDAASNSTVTEKAGRAEKPNPNKMVRAKFGFGGGRQTTNRYQSEMKV